MTGARLALKIRLRGLSDYRDRLASRASDEELARRLRRHVENALAALRAEDMNFFHAILRLDDHSFD